ncbi:hypothetical protein P8C59_001595 [Phyllachora maydis]|uniref:Uncharacterized protein n=1 Tax=Phyllachora maydis TaxID=1825666 RepID=A0AAD9MBK2_9PEZI|nr:hypothetical protein P8C59_001595 [Phyllachora maydis]
MQAYLVAALRRAAKQCAVFALLRSGGAPGIMYCQGREDGVREWVATVQRLRYKDYQLIAKPRPQRGLAHWWQRAMGYSSVCCVKRANWFVPTGIPAGICQTP